MKRAFLGGVLYTFVITFAPLPTEAALVSRLGGQLVYDDVLDITWLVDANLSASNTFGVAGIGANGLMNWDTANNWIAAMNADGGTGYLGFNQWRLPQTLPLNGTNYVGGLATDGSTDDGFNISAPGSAFPGSTAHEMAHLYYGTLGNIGAVDIAGNDNGCTAVFPGPGCLANTGPFQNIQTIDSSYWSGSDLTDVGRPDLAWDFHFFSGFQFTRDKQAVSAHAFAVLPGDLAAVPVPAAVWLFGSGWLGLIGIARRKKTS